MDFAEKQLKKHGWSNGDGLGKERQGMKEAIKVKMKFDSTGVGHDSGQEFSFHWWDHVFNKAASNIHVQESQHGVELKNLETTNVSKKKTKSFADKSMLYGQFVKGATLSDGTESRDAGRNADTSDEETVTQHCLLPSNEETVFKMCGGRTAHKGARHGLKLNGKLQRIQEQEQLLMNQSNTSSLIAQDVVYGAEDKGSKKSKKKKRKRQNEDKDDITRDVEQTVPTECENGIESGDLDKEEIAEEETGTKRRKKSKKKTKEPKDEIMDAGKIQKFNENVVINDIDNALSQNNEEVCGENGNSKKKKKSSRSAGDDSVSQATPETGYNEQVDSESIKKKKKKKKDK